MHIVRDGDVFVTAGFEVEAHGCWHAVLHRDIPVVANTGFLIDGRLFHPGDALTVPAKPVTTLMVPVHGLWSRIADVIDWVREVAPQRTFATHDGFLNPMGIAITGGLLGENGPGIDATYRRLEPFDEVDGI